MFVNLFIIALKSVLGNPNVNYRNFIESICANCENADLVNNIHQYKPSIITSAVESLRGKGGNTRFHQFKTELEAINFNNKILLTEVNNVSDIEEGAVLMLDSRHVGIIVDHPESINSNNHIKHDLRVLHYPEEEGQLSPTQVLKDSLNFISGELLPECKAILDNDLPHIKQSDAVDRESYTAYQEERSAHIAKIIKLEKMANKLQSIVKGLGNQLAELDPNLNIEVFTQAILSKEVYTPQQQLVIDHANQLLTTVFG